MTVALVTLAGMAVLMGLRAYFLSPEGWSALAPDEAQRAWHALQVTQGRVIYRDVWVQYTPLSFYWHALAFWIFGPSLAAIRLALVATGTLTLALVASAASRLGGSRAAVTAGVLFLTFGVPSYNSGYPAWEAMVLSMGALAIVLRWRSHRSAFAAGLLVGLSMMTKINVGALSSLALAAVYASGCSRLVRMAVGLGSMAVMAWLLRSMPPAESLVQFLLPLGAVLAVLMWRNPHQNSFRSLLAAVTGCALACIVVLAPFALTLGASPVLNAVIGEPLRFSRLIAYDSPILRLGLPVYGTMACWVAALTIPFVARRLKPVALAAAVGGVILLLLDACGLLPGLTMGARFLMAPVV
ncbi:hypothetical protein JXA88_07690, partial [Candidatus Fermentibacteria bacterium]|nr:hypothetical protein [Candidatus Fermentibacteria bacterium]